MEADEASFRTCIDSISMVASSDMDRVVGVPSIIYNGLLLFNVPSPLMRTVAGEVGEPLVVTAMPATFPWAARIAFPDVLERSWSTLITETAPVRSALRWVV